MVSKTRAKNIVVLGGGTGAFTVLSGLKQDQAMRDGVLNLAAVVTMADNGGSSGILRDELDVLPPGDIRQAILALADERIVSRELFNQRLKDKSLEGHAVGNLFLASLEALLGDPLRAIEWASRIFNCCGKVIPVTTKATNLSVTLEDNSVIDGEHAIDASVTKRSPIKECRLTPEIDANPEALEMIRQADVVVIGPGDLYTSVVPVLLVRGVTEALKEVKKVVYVVNLMTKRGQTDGFKASTFRRVIDKYCQPAQVHFTIVNGEVPSDEIVALYEKEGEFLVEDDLPAKRNVIRAPLIDDLAIKRVPGDMLRRSLIRHDRRELARAILSCLREYAWITRSS